LIRAFTFNHPNPTYDVLPLATKIAYILKAAICLLTKESIRTFAPAYSSPIKVVYVGLGALCNDFFCVQHLGRPQSRKKQIEALVKKTTEQTFYHI
jgi:hypothetical protein